MTPGQKVELINTTFGSLTIDQRFAVINCLFCNSLLTTSFGKYSATMLHLSKEHMTNQKVLFVDTGFLTRQTYLHKKTLMESLKLNLLTYVPQVTRAELETHHDIPDANSSSVIAFQNSDMFPQIRSKIKLEPFKQALKELQPDVWLTGLMRSEGKSRADLDFASMQNGIVKVLPILDWTIKQSSEYCVENELPLNESYIDICKPAKQECGIHI